jgi:hypothetical protein
MTRESRSNKSFTSHSGGGKADRSATERNLDNFGKLLHCTLNNVHETMFGPLRFGRRPDAGNLSVVAGSFESGQRITRGYENVNQQG